MVKTSSPDDYAVQEFIGEWDDEGVFVYQAFNNEIADWALKHQKFGGPNFNPTRMTWFKPSFAWMLYRAGYGHKSNQEKILKIKLSHEDVATILSHCYCTIHGEKGTIMKGEGRVQWDPSRDLYSAKNGYPRKVPGLRAIQIGVSGSLSKFYAASPLSIEDVTELAHRVKDAHGQESPTLVMDMMNALDLPEERTYYPRCERGVLIRLGMMRGETAKAIAQIGFTSPMKTL